MIRILVLASILIPVLSWSTSWAETVNPKTIGSTIAKAHQESMSEFFGKLQELSVKQESERDFYAAIFGFKADDSRLSVFARDRKPPRIVKISNGINISGLEGNPITVRLGRAIGTVEISGMTEKGSGKKSASRLMNLNGILSALLPSANAGLWDWIVMRGLGRLTEVGSEMWEAADWGRRYTNAERAALLAKGTAHLTAEGAIVGCVIGLHISEGDKLEDCGNGAKLGATSMVSMVVGFGAIGGGLAATEKVVAVTLNAFDKLPVAKQLAFKKATSYVGKIGVAAALAHGADSLVKSDGVKLTCFNDGNFRISDLSLTDSARTLLEIDGPRVKWFSFGSGSFTRSPESIVSFLEKHESYKLLQADARQLLAKSVVADLDRYAGTCKKHGEGYTEVYRLESDKAAVEVGKDTAKESKTVK